jgi:hypothetical protein
MSKVFFQIGTNDGNDMFRDFVKKNKPDLVILVEPNEVLINEIKKTIVILKMFISITMRFITKMMN